MITASCGNTELLKLPKTAFLCSRNIPASAVSKEIRGTDTHFFEVKTVKRIFLLEKMNSGEGVPGY